MPAERQGSRWLHEPPTEEQVVQWFDSQHLHEGMNHGAYYGGIVVIGAKETIKVTASKQNGDTFLREMEQAVFVPYVKVDTRIAYFWELVRVMNALAEEDKYVGVIEPVKVPRFDKESDARYNAHMPDGFFMHVAKNGNDDSYTRYLCCTQRVAIYERQSYAKVLAGQPAMPVLQGVGTKQTPLAKRFADDNAIMKAETGAIGRALGVAGILVVGTGVATAEDMQEQRENVPGAGATKGGPDAAALPDDAPATDATEAAVPGDDPGPSAPKSPQEEDEERRARALAISQEMQSDFPQLWEATQAWWKGRAYPKLSEMTGPALKGVLTKLERDLDAAKVAAAAEEVPEAAQAEKAPPEGVAG